MAKYKVLKSVAHNVAESFTSLMNYAQNDYVMGLLLSHARESGETSFFIDFLSGESSPVFARSPLTQVAPFYIKRFWDDVERQGSNRSLVRAARLTLSFNTDVKRPVSSDPKYQESPYTCTFSLVDDRGVEHGRTLEGWWFPEPYQSPPGLRG